MGTGLVFVGLNLTDTALTLCLAPMGDELNWYSAITSPILFIVLKVVFMVLALYCVYRFNRRLLKPLNVGMAAVVGCNLTCLVAYLIGYF